VGVNEGDTAQNAGTFADLDLSDSVTLNASVGDVVQGSGNAGAWSWSLANLDGPDDTQTVVITADDGKGGTTTAGFTLTVNNVAPTGVANAYGVDEDHPLNIAAPGVLENDTDPVGDADPLTAALVTDVSNGTLTLHGDGSFSYVPNADFNGTDTFEYKAVDDDGGESAATTVTITVNPVNDAPVASTASLTTDEDSAVEVDLRTLVQDVETADDDLVFAVRGAVNGTVSLLPDGYTARFEPNPGFPGPDANGAASFTYDVTDTGDPAGTPESAITVEGVTIGVAVRNLVDLSGRLFDDRDNDAVFDPSDGDAGFDGLLVELVDQSDGSVVQTATTADGGVYEFQNLAQGTYTIRQGSQPAGYFDGRESTGDLGGPAADNGATIDDADSNEITDVVIGPPGTQQDTPGYNFGELLPARLQGLVWEDFDDDGNVDLGERAIGGVTITLSGTDDRGGTVNIPQNTDAQGVFEFVDLRPGTYVLTQSQPAGYVDGQEVLGQVVEAPPAVVTGADGFADADTTDAAGAVVGSSFSEIVLVAGSRGINYNFGERVDGGEVSTGQTATIGFWQNKNGQNLIKSLNGDEDSTLLAEYLSETFPNMYGTAVVYEGTNALFTNVEVATLYRDLFKRNARTSPGGPPKLDAQVLAVALATYVTKEGLAGLIYDDSGLTQESFLFTDVDVDGVYELSEGDTATIDAALIAAVESYGFDVTAGGVGSCYFNVGNSSAAFEVDDNTEMQIIDMLLATDRMSTGGVLYDANGDGIDDDEELLRTLANDVYSAINQQGHI